MARFFGWLFLAVCMAFWASAPHAQGYDNSRWSMSADGRSAGICNTSGSYFSCFAVACDDAGALAFQFSYNVGSYAQNPTARFDTGRYAANLAFRTGEAGRMSMAIDPGQHAAALEGLAKGKALIFAPGFEHKFSLRGSGKAIGAIRSTCLPRKTAPVGSTVTALSEPPAQDETALVWPQGQSHWRMFFNTDFPGNDLINGFDDSTLKDVPESVCERRCKDLSRCAGYTYFRKTCLLKTAMVNGKSFQGARSARLDQRQTPRPDPRLPAPAVKTVRNLPKTSPAIYLDAVRAAAAAYGDQCEVERNEMAALARNFDIALDDGAQPVQAGKALTVSWRGNTLTRALPVWVMVTSDAPIRFSGLGSYALGPGAVGPFGISTDQTRTRGITALYARGAGQTGQLNVIPLQAGPQELDLVLVGYLRGCQETVELSRTTQTIDPTPSRLELVLHDEFDVGTWTHEIRLPQHERILRFDDQRMLLLDAVDLSEISDRAGKNISVSPTGRFVALGEPGVVIDVVDGAVVAEHDIYSAYEAGWFNHDSYALSDVAPWGDIDLISLFHDGVQVRSQNTAPACCDARGSKSTVTVDLENNAVIVAGVLGHQITALQNRNISDAENAPTGYLLDGKVTDSALLNAVAMFSPVTDVDLAPIWNTPIGPTFTRRIGSRARSIDAPYWPDAAIPLDAQALAAGPPVTGQTVRFRGLARYDWEETIPEVSSLQADLERVGLQFAPMVKATAKWQPSDGNLNMHFQEAAFAPPYVAMRTEMTDNLAQYGFALNWSLPQDGDPLTDCVDFQSGDVTSLTRQAANIPRFASRFDTVHHIAHQGRDIWIMRVVCNAGATFGSLRQESFTAVFDSERVASMSPSDMVIDESAYLGNSGYDPFAETPMNWQLYGDRYLLGYGQTGGKFKVFDLETWQLIHKQSELERGSLMADAALTDDFRHLVQINTDGSFAVYQLDGFKRVLDGRVVDKEVGVWNRLYQFDATAEGGSYISLRFPGIGGTHALDQFDRALRVPNLVQKTLQGDDPGPAVDIALPPQLAGTLTAQGADISIDYSLSSNPDGVMLHLYQDGLLTRSEPATGARGAFLAPRLDAAQWASLVAVNQDGLSGLPIGADLGPTDSRALLHIMSVGVDIYDDAALPDLAFAASDAALAAQSLSTRAQSRLDVQPAIVLTNQDATQTGILSKTKLLVDALQPGDHAVLFFAGHGVLDENGAFRLALTDSDTNDLDASALKFEEISTLVANAKGRVTILLDACHSGATGTGMFASHDDVVGRLGARVPPNVLIMSASRGRETSLESPDLQAGLFTRSMADVLSDSISHDLNGNGRLELSEFYRSVRSLVSTRSNGAQNPWIVRSRAVGDFALF